MRFYKVHLKLKPERGELDNFFIVQAPGLKEAKGIALTRIAEMGMKTKDLRLIEEEPVRAQNQ